MTGIELIEAGRTWLRAKYKGYDELPPRERRVLAAAWLCDIVRPRELHGKNDGVIVEAIQDAGGGVKGQPWCAYAQYVAARISKTWAPKIGPGAVKNWKDAAAAGLRLIRVSDAVRGDLLIRDFGEGKRHIGIKVRDWQWGQDSIEGNTSPGDEGSQRDGQGMYRRKRLTRFWTHAIRGD